MNKKRLLKDLPFCNLTAGKVLTKANGGYYIDGGELIYSGGGHSSNGIEALNTVECSIVDLIWEDAKWMEDAKIKHIEAKAGLSSITLSFKPVDLGQSQTLAMGIVSCLTRFFGTEDGQHTWDEFRGFTISIR